MEWEAGTSVGCRLPGPARLSQIRNWLGGGAGWDSTMAELFTVQALGPEFNPQNPRKERLSPVTSMGGRVLAPPVGVGQIEETHLYSSLSSPALPPSSPLLSFEQLQFRNQALYIHRSLGKPWSSHKAHGSEFSSMKYFPVHTGRTLVPLSHK